MDIQTAKDKNLILLECISGSRAYGLSTPESDTDIRGVFIMPKNDFYGLEYVSQISNDKNDIVYFELKRFMELLSKNNPTIMELLSTPAHSLLYKYPLMEAIVPEHFLSKQCKNTFAGYAMTQVKKARGLNKKISKPMEKERKGILDFCYVVHNQGSIPVTKWLDKMDYQQQYCGLSKIPHMHDVYGLYYGENKGYKGIVHKPDANDVSLSSIPKDEQPIVIMSFNKSGYSQYCKDYKEYWQWVEERNESRYESTMMHGKNYDAKNMMHTFRLLNMAEEIGREGKINVWREDRDFLLGIRTGQFEYEELLKMAEEKIDQIEEVYEKSSLPEEPDYEKINLLLVEIREGFYR